MAEITKISSPLVPKENVGNRFKPTTDQAFELTDPSKIHKPTQEGKIFEQRPDGQALRDSMGRAAVASLLKDTGDLSAVIRRLALLIETGISTTDVMEAPEMRSLLKSIFVTPENMLASVQEQEKSAIVFKGEAFDVLRDLLARFQDNPKIRDAVASLLKAFECNVNTQNSIRAILINCENVLDYLFSKDKAQFSDYLDGLTDTILPKGEEKAAGRPAQGAAESGQQPGGPQPGRGTSGQPPAPGLAGSQPPQNTLPQNMPQGANQQNIPQDTTQQNLSQNAGQQNVPQDAGQQNAPQNAGQQNIPQNAGQQNIPQDTGQQNILQNAGQQNISQTTGQQNVPQDAAQQNLPQDAARQVPTQGMFSSAQQSAPPSQTAQIPFANGQEQAVQEQGQQPPVSAGRQDARQMEEASSQPVLSHKETAQILKSNLLPLLGEIVVKYNQNERIRDHVMVAVHNTVRVDQGTPEALRSAVGKLVQELRQLANLPENFSRNLTDAIFMSSRDAKEAGNQFLEKLVDVVNETLRSEHSSPATIRQAETLLMSLLQNQSAMMDVLHYVIPIHTANDEMIAEMYVDPNSGNGDEKANGEHSRKIFLAFESKAHGAFELSFVQTGDYVDFAIWCPGPLLQGLSGMKRFFSNIMQAHGYTMSGYSIEEYKRPQSVAEVFPNLLNRRVGIDVRV